MSLCFCPDVRNEDELLEMLKQGRFDKDIYDYLIEIMCEKENRLLDYIPVELFEMQAKLLDQNELLCFLFWDKSESGIYEDFQYRLNKTQRELFDQFVIRINEIYESLTKLVKER